MDPNSTEGSNPNTAEAVTATETTTQDRTSTEGNGTEGQEKGGTDAAATETEKTESTEDKDKTEAEGAPETYEAFTLPEGYTLEGERLEMAVSKFKELNLPQSAAQGLIDVYVKADAENAAARDALLTEARAQQIEAWGTESRDQLGDKFDQALSNAALAVSLVGDPEVSKAFDELGWGNHPAMIKAFAFFGSKLGETGMDGVGGGRGGGGEKPLASRMYPNM